MIGRTNAGGGGGKKSLVLPTNPNLSIKSDDSKLVLSWVQPKTEVEIDHYNIYTSLTEPSSLKDMDLVGSVDAKESVPITFASSIDNYSKGGLSISKISDGKYSVVSDGSGSGGISVACGNFTKENGKTYELYGCPSGGSSTTYCLRTGDNSTKYDDFGNGVSFVSSEDANNAYLFFSLYSNVEYDVIFEPKIDKINNSFDLTNLTNNQTYYVGIQSVTSDGYENASIWKVQNGVPSATRFVCVGASGKSYYSTNGTSWTAMSGLNTSYAYNGVTYGNERFVCIGHKGNSCYSIDGINWVAMSGLESSLYYYGVTYGNGRFVCVSDAGFSYYSTDGTTWVAMSGLASAYYFGVTYGNGRFVCVGESGKSYYSTDGTTWVAMSGLDKNWSYYAVTYGNGRFVCVGNNGYSYYSTNGTTWVAMSGLASAYYFGVTYGNGRFVCVGQQVMSYYSIDGLSWTAMSGLDTSSEYRGVTYGNGRFVCVGSKGRSYYSTNGVDWVSMSGLDTSTNYLGVTNNKWNVA